MTLECVVNVSEGTDAAVLADLADQCGPTLLDIHHDPHHNRSVFTMAGPDDALEGAVRALARRCVERLDLSTHEGAHPRLGVLDVVPFVTLTAGPENRDRLDLAPPLGPAVAARDRFAAWAGTDLDLPTFLYGPFGPGGSRALPTVRRGAFSEFRPDTGPPEPHPRAGAVAVGARGFLIAYNLWVEDGGVALARAVATAIRGPRLRAMGFELGRRVQVSCNLVDPEVLGPDAVYDDVARRLAVSGAGIGGCELVGLIPQAALDKVAPHRRAELDLEETSTIEARLDDRGFSWR